ncbi:MAG: prolipoprotein diacylglyceryl transferase [Chloroflexi bacterium]|nr:prolipoprotein diacylglyceryl transferase [Chloroflexota bacterium]
MIEIDIGPNLVTLGTFVLSWHGFFSFIAVATAVYLVGRWAPSRGIDPDAIYSIAIWGIIGGIIGARFVHVIDNWTFYSNSPGQILAIYSGGIGVWGGILGGFIAAAAYALRTHHPVGIIADLTAPALLIVQTIGRLGDIVNGEHCAKAADFFLSFVWTNPASDARICDNGVGVSVHPVIAYEMIWNLLALIVIWRLRGKIRPAGMLFALYLALYSVGRFAISFAREDRVWALNLQEAHYIALLVLAITVPLMIIKARPATGAEAELSTSPAQAPSPRGTRAQRRRRR